MKHQTSIIITVIVSMSLLLVSCNNPNKYAYNYSYEQRFITLTTEPSNAKVTLVQPFGQPSVSLGKAPLNSFPVAVMMRLKSENIRVIPQEYVMHLGNAVVRIEHEGYESYYAPLNTHPSGTAKHHIKLRPLTK